MIGSESSRRNAVVISIGWWYLRRLIRKRGAAAVAGFVAGEGLSFARRPRRRHRVRSLLVLGLVVALGLLCWRRQRGGGDDGGDGASLAPLAPEPAEPVPVPEPASAADPVAS